MSGSGGWRAEICFAMSWGIEKERRGTDLETRTGEAGRKGKGGRPWKGGRRRRQQGDGKSSVRGRSPGREG